MFPQFLKDELRFDIEYWVISLNLQCSIHLNTDTCKVRTTDFSDVNNESAVITTGRSGW